MTYDEQAPIAVALGARIRALREARGSTPELVLLRPPGGRALRDVSRLRGSGASLRVIAYASRTGTKRNLAALRGAGWRLLVSATGRHNAHGFQYGIDNGAWTAFQAGTPFDAGRFEKLLGSHGDEADWIVVPDIVEGGLESLAFSRSWLPRLNSYRLLLLPVQDGMTEADVRPLLGPGVGIFVGGSTEWKLRTALRWGALAREVGAYLHVGRVNSQKRIRLCQEAGAHSFDGTSVTRYAKRIVRLDRAVRQGHLDWSE